MTVRLVETNNLFRFLATLQKFSILLKCWSKRLLGF